MKFLQAIHPKSRLRQWLDINSITETPDSYAVACGLSVIGTAFRRHLFVDQVNFKVFPMLRVMLVGPPGIGKDTAINVSKWAVEKLSLPVIGGITKEHLQSQLAQMLPPQTAFVAAGELSSFMGRSDYQTGMMQFLTDLFSDGDAIDASCKTDPERKIIEPTVTMQCGSTVEWLHTGLPDNAMAGGFVPRFLVVSEDYPGRHIALIKRELSKAQLAHVEKCKRDFINWLGLLAKDVLAGKPREIIWDNEGAGTFKHWYENRTKFFPSTVLPYAQRSRDNVLRLAMLHAVSRGSFCIEQPDVSFAIIFIAYIAERIAAAIIPPTVEAQCGNEILKLLPAEKKKVYRTLREKYHLRTIRESMDSLVASGELVQKNDMLEGK